MRIRLLSSGLMGLLILTACSGASAPAQPKEIVLETKEFGFTPAQIEVTAGQPVRLKLHNTGTLQHDFGIMQIPMEMHATAMPMGDHAIEGMPDQPQLHLAAMPGQDNVLEFTPTQAGTYEFFCSVAGHKDAGMTGTLVVNAP